MATNNLPTTIVTGFLGSGKTTIISHLVDWLVEQDLKVAYVKNEIGDLDVDTALLKGKHIQTRELLNGCICCTLVGPFMSAINELIETTHPDRILIEASGAAETSSLALMVSSHPRLNRDGVINVVDVVNFQGNEDLSLTTRHQAQFTDLIVFNKVELADLEQKQRVVGYVREINETAPIVEAPGGSLNPQLAFGISSGELNELLAQPHVHSHHLAADQIEGFHLEFSEILTTAQLEAFLNQLPKNIFRVKGVVNIKSIDQENTRWQVINRVGTRTTFQLFEHFSADTSQLVLIGFRALAQQSEITLTWQQFLSSLSSSK